jgi:prolyl-tRNA synthetase
MNPRFGLLRGKQFLMNDLYSFDVDEKAAKDTYKVHFLNEEIFNNLLRRLMVQSYRVCQRFVIIFFKC